uniref:NADH-ubiquinone oxidoreductase chain 4L n=1 Tax=Ptenothrix huangshanensis TaxID=2583244 RepID=A0A6H0EW36_9HEXA|nr:NADH dehydrogenase subunit 4L [Ptenothrix huangshanensis]
MKLSSLMFLIYFFMILSGMYVYSSKRKHLLLTLLSLEFMSLSIFFIFFDVLGYFNFFFTLLYLVFAACEAALGLSVLISISRVYGSDYFNVFSFN